MEKKSYSEVFPFFESVFNIPIQNYTDGMRQLKIPILPVKVLKDLLTDCLEIFKNESTLLEVDGPMVVIGDLHGHLLDLLRILSIFLTPKRTKFLFLGDLVDRGEFSLETIILVLTMKALWPDRVYIIRGNHEFLDIFSDCGFANDVMSVYRSSAVVNLFADVFGYIPLAAICKKYLFIHGGIGPSVTKLSDISNTPRPISSFSTDIITDLLWSDPNPNIISYATSTRGLGHYFGIEAIDNFLKNNNIECIVRGHQCIEDGVRSMYGGKVITVFSASSYCGDTMNKAGILIVRGDGKIECKVYDPLPYILRNNAVIYRSESEETFTVFPMMPNPKSIVFSGRETEKRKPSKLLKQIKVQNKVKVSSSFKSEKIRFSTVEIGKPMPKKPIIRTKHVL